MVATCIFFEGETKISTGIQQKHGDASALNSNLAGNNIFQVGRTFSLVEQHYSVVVTGVRNEWHS